MATYRNCFSTIKRKVEISKAFYGPSPPPIPAHRPERVHYLMKTILLLTASNLFMTVAWYGHLKFKFLEGKSLFFIILNSRRSRPSNSISGIRRLSPRAIMKISCFHLIHLKASLKQGVSCLPAIIKFRLRRYGAKKLLQAFCARLNIALYPGFLSIKDAASAASRSLPSFQYIAPYAPDSPFA